MTTWLVIGSEAMVPVLDCCIQSGQCDRHEIISQIQACNVTSGAVIPAFSSLASVAPASVTASSAGRSGSASHTFILGGDLRVRGIHLQQNP